MHKITPAAAVVERQCNCGLVVRYTQSLGTDNSVMARQIFLLEPALLVNSVNSIRTPSRNKQIAACCLCKTTGCFHIRVSVMKSSVCQSSDGGNSTSLAIADIKRVSSDVKCDVPRAKEERLEVVVWEYVHQLLSIS